MQFSELNIHKSILQALVEQGYTNPTPIQEQAIPIILEGIDLLGVAQTGTGKTAAFSIPIIHHLITRPKDGRKKIRALILTPTRELAIQIDENIKAYSRHTNLQHTVIFGGVKSQKQSARIRAGIDILVATPGRLLDLMNQGIVNIRDIEFFVLDEADRMLDMGFIHDVKRIINVIPQKRQTLFFSATMPTEIVKLSSTILRHPKKVSVTPVSSTAELIRQYIYFVDKGNKNALLVDILENQAIKTALVFTRTKYGADKLVKHLLKSNIKAEAIHGNKAQNARQKALENFKAQTTRVLVATDIAARGIDVDNLAYVINYEMSNIAETYVHRIGRTGRAGADGTALSFCDQEEKAYLKDVEKLINKKIPVVEGHPYPLSNKGGGEKAENKNQQKPKPKNSRTKGNGQRRY